MAKIRLRVQPSASRECVVGKVGDEWKIAVKAPPVDGRANKACVAFLAKLLGASKSGVSIVAGASSRTKTFEVEGWTVEEIDAKLRGQSA